MIYLETYNNLKGWFIVKCYDYVIMLLYFNFYSFLLKKYILGFRNSYVT
jgi:hypothetical protein